MRVFKYKWFHRWAKDEQVSDAVLMAAARGIVEGQFDADLGGYLYKKRIARHGSGKSSGYRAIVGYKRPDDSRVVFLYAFPKNSKANISTKEKAALQLTAKGFVNATEKQLEELMANNEYREINADE
jgi:hypothetical protein